MLEKVGQTLVRMGQSTGELLALTAETLYHCRRAPHNLPAIAVQLREMGIHTLPIALLMAFFVGMVLALNTGLVLADYGGTSFIGGIVGMSMVKELGPVMTAFLVAGRIGSAMAAELGAMQVYEEIDALRTLEINPVRYLVMPRFIACTMAVPAVVVFVMILGIAGGAMVSAANPRIGVPMTVYYDAVLQALDAVEVFKGLCKAMCFGAIIALVGCHTGFSTRGGARGIGAAATRSVVLSFLLVLIADYFLTRIML